MNELFDFKQRLVDLELFNMKLTYSNKLLEEYGDLIREEQKKDLIYILDNNNDKEGIKRTYKLLDSLLGLLK